MLARLSVLVVQEFLDGDRITAEYEMPVVLDTMNNGLASEIIAYHLNAMALALKGVDKEVHRVQ